MTQYEDVMFSLVSTSLYSRTYLYVCSPPMPHGDPAPKSSRDHLLSVLAASKMAHPSMFIGSKTGSICTEPQLSGAKWGKASVGRRIFGCVGLACDYSGGYLSVG